MSEPTSPSSLRSVIRKPLNLRKSSGASAKTSHTVPSALTASASRPESITNSTSPTLVHIDEAQANTTPGTAEYLATKLIGPNHTCGHFPKIKHGEVSGIPRYLGFYHVSDTNITYLNTRKLCLDCYRDAVPEGFNVWSMYYTNFDLRAQGKGWLNIVPSEYHYPQMIQAGTEGFVGSLKGFQASDTFVGSYGKKPGTPAIPIHVPIPQITEAKAAWRWLQMQGKPFYIDQLHLNQGWNVLAERKAQEDAMVAGANGSPYYKEAVELHGSPTAASPRKLAGNNRKFSGQNKTRKSPSLATNNGGLAKSKERDETIHELPADRPILHKKPRPKGQRRATEQSKKIVATMRPASKLIQRHSTPLVSDQYTDVDELGPIQHNRPTFSESPSDINGQAATFPAKRTSNRARNIARPLGTASDTSSTYPTSPVAGYTPLPTLTITTSSIGKNDARDNAAITDNIHIPQQRRFHQEQRPASAGPQVTRPPPNMAKSQSARKETTPKASHTKAARALPGQQTNAYQSQIEQGGATQMQVNGEIETEDGEGSLTEQDEEYQIGDSEEGDESNAEGEESQGEEQLEDSSDVDRADGSDGSEIGDSSSEDHAQGQSSDHDEASDGDNDDGDELDDSRDEDVDEDHDNGGDDDEVDDVDDDDNLSI